jgi:hypothetical protein
LQRICLLLTQSGHHVARRVVIRFNSTRYVRCDVEHYSTCAMRMKLVKQSHWAKVQLVHVTIEIVCEAYLKARRRICDISKPDPVNEIIALRILALAKQGERDPDRLRAGALATLQVQPRF